MAEQEHVSVRDTVAQLRERHAHGMTSRTGQRAAAALEGLAHVWTERLRGGWSPPEGSPFPWPMTRVSLEGLLPGLRAARDWLAWTTRGVPAARDGFVPDREGRRVAARGPDVVAHVLAGNTPLLAWPGLAAATLAGSASIVKMSRDETFWPRAFARTLAEVDAELASLIHLDVWPGEDARTAELLQAADAVIAYGSDAALAAVRKRTPIDTLFLPHGHALSVGLVLAAPGYPPGGGGFPDAAGFARDVLLYDQGGCLSPHAIFTEGGAADAAAGGAALARALAVEADALEIPPVTDAGTARAVRQARDLALFVPGAVVRGDPGLRWTVITYAQEKRMDTPTGHGVVSVSPLAEVAAGFGPALGAARGRVSAVGVAGPLREDVRRALLRESVSRVCAPGAMQAPPLDWPNGGRDLLASLLHWTQIEPGVMVP